MVAAKNLAAAGRWLKLNGDAVYGAAPSPFAEGFWWLRSKIARGNGNTVFLPFLDRRCTTRPGKINFTIFHWPGTGFKLPAFKNDIKKAFPLRDRAGTEIRVAVINNIRIVQTPHHAPDVMATVLVVEFNGDRIER